MKLLLPLNYISFTTKKYILILAKKKQPILISKRWNFAIKPSLFGPYKRSKKFKFWLILNHKMNTQSSFSSNTHTIGSSFIFWSDSIQSWSVQHIWRTWDMESVGNFTFEGFCFFSSKWYWIWNTRRRSKFQVTYSYFLSNIKVFYDKLIFVWWRNTFENIRWINNLLSKYSYIITINNSQYITFYWKIEKWLCDEDLLTGMRRLKIIFFPSKSLDCTRPQGISFHWNLFFILWWRFWYKILNPVPFFYTFPLPKLTWWRLVLGTI